MHHKRINIFTGNFGSGKTEVSVNYAMRLGEIFNRTAIVDLDIVNPYFRTADAKEELERKGVLVITPLFANTNVDIPALPPEINMLLENKEYTAVFDVGGDDVGALALSRYKEKIMEEDYGHYFVVNVNRPMTNSVEKIKEMFYSIEESSGLKITGIVNNTNLLENTRITDILKGQEIIEKAALELGVPVVFTSIFKGIFNKNYGTNYCPEADTERIGIKGNILLMEKMIRLPWEK